MPRWNTDYYTTLVERFNDITHGLDGRLEDVIQGRVTPSTEDLEIGSAKSVRAAVMFFDICNFSSRTGSPELESIKRALLTLDCVIPMITHVIHDYGGYIEKNTGDGVMGIVGIDKTDEEAADAALDIAVSALYALENLVNPFLFNVGIPHVSLTVGIDLGPLLLARIGNKTGNAKLDRNFLTAVGPSANLACRLQQEIAGENEIWTGNNIFQHSAASRKKYFTDKTPPGWTWIYHGTTTPYKIWHYNATRVDPQSLTAAS